MNALLNIKSVAAVAIFSVLAVGSAAQAGGYGYGGYSGHGHGGYGHSHGGYGHGGYGYQPQYGWKTITVYETIQKPYYDVITKYHPCGTPYTVEVVRYETVQIPVQKRIRVQL